MNLRFALRTARRELAGSGRRLGTHMLAIAVGVAALVAIGGFRHDVERSVAGQARELLGADVVFRSNRPWPDSSLARLDSIAELHPSAHVTSFASMALAPRTGLARLVHVQAVGPGYPFYGTIATEPAGQWNALQEGKRTLVDPAVLIQLDLAVGDTLWIGESGFHILGVVTNRPGDVGLQMAIGARVYLADRDLPATGLITRGSRAFFERYLVFESNAPLQMFLNANNALFGREQVRFETANDQEADIADALGALARFLGLVGLAALLLGGVGVASAVNVFVRQRLDTVATLRCLGARQSTVFAAYVMVAVALGALGATLGVAAGIAIQLVLPRVFGDFLPLAITPRPSGQAALTGLAIGTWTALLFSLLPLLAIRNTPPLRALRRDVEPVGGRDPWRWVVMAVLAGTVVFLSLSQAPNQMLGLGFAAAIAVTTAVLWLVALLLVRATRRFTPRRVPWVVRQGIANLFRPRNQTVAVTLALGFGVFLLATLWVVQRNLLDQFATDARPDRPNLVLFDIQTDQLADVRAQLIARDLRLQEVTPIVSARVAAINGRRVERLLDDSSSVFTGSRWALRREYRHTWRDTLTASEEIVAGTWWSRGDAEARSVARISVERDIMSDLGVVLGDTITWNVQGVEIPTVIASVRRVNWARFETNFFVVFEPGVLEDAPATWVILTRADSVRTRGELQRDLVASHPNVLALDLSIVQQTLDRVLNRVSLAIRFMALFSIAAGVLILVGALAASRAQRLREIVLFKTLGARMAQVRRILLTEYAALGALGALAGITLAAVGGWLAVTFVFDIAFRLPVAGITLAGIGGWLAVTFVFDIAFRLPVAGLTVAWFGTALLTLVVGALTGGEALRKPPLEALREFGE